MTYELIITNKDGEQIFKVVNESQEMLEEEIGRYERHFKPVGAR